MSWQPIETAPKGGGAELVTDPDYVQPPLILLRFGSSQAVCHWDWYYAEGGAGYAGVDAWVEPVSDSLVVMHYGPPTHWMPLPSPPVQP